MPKTEVTVLNNGLRVASEDSGGSTCTVSFPPLQLPVCVCVCVRESVYVCGRDGERERERVCM